MIVIKNILLGFALLILLSGCNDTNEKLKTNVITSKTAIIDLTTVLKATGQDDVITKQMEIVNADLKKQLEGIVVNLNKQLADQKEKFGKDITVEQQQQLQELLIKANQQLQKTETVANQKSLQHKEGLILAWRNKVQPMVKTIAKKHGADVVLIKSPTIVWFDLDIDITDEVIAEIRKNPIKEEVSNKGSENKNTAPPQITSGDVI